MSIRENLAQIHQQIAAAAEQSGRSPQTVRLLAVSKRIDADRVQQAYDCGQRMFGENQVQELESKPAKLPPDCEWHMIGHLQSNKVRSAVLHSQWIHSVDRMKLLRRIERIAGEEGKRPKILLQVNISGEQSKFGAPVDAVENLVENALKAENLDCCGFMTMAPFDADDAELRRVFGGLRQLRDRMSQRFSVELPELSMGMSGDFQTAIAEGATIVRVGTAVFGERQY